MAKLFSGSGLQPGAIMDDSYVAVTIVSSDHQAYFGTAPMSGIRISEATDTSISKSLEGSFLVSAFGDIPVQIEINGLQAYWICGSASDGNTIAKLYNEFKVSANAESRIKLQLSGAPQVYTGIITGFTASVNHDRSPGTYSYTLKILATTAVSAQ